jgi:hypothetical protein
MGEGAVMIDLAAYAPVVRFTLEGQGAFIMGQAAPRGGPAPCVLKLTSDDRPIAYARATRFSPAAQMAGLRAGWCGFHLHGVREAFAIGEEVAVSCGVSGERLASINLDQTLMSTAPGQSVTLTVSDLVALARDAEMAPDAEAILPFAVGHLKRRGARPFIEAAYRTLLRRWPDDGVDYDQLEGETDEGRAADYLARIGASEEFEQKWGGRFPGPFNPSFAFDRDLID